VEPTAVRTVEPTAERTDRSTVGTR
jgi:hypothetical protein